MAGRAVEPSTISLLGLVRHLAEVGFATQFGHVDLVRERIDGRLGQ